MLFYFTMTIVLLEVLRSVLKAVIVQWSGLVTLIVANQMTSRSSFGSFCLSDADNCFA